MNHKNFMPSVLNSMSDQIYVRDLDMNILYINPAAEKLTGWSLDEARNRKCYEIFGDKKGQCRHICPVDKVIEEKIPIMHHEGVLETRKGSLRKMQVSISPLEEDGAINGGIVVMQDMSRMANLEETHVKTLIELEKSEERLNLAMEFSSDGLFDWNLEDDSIYYSSGWKKMLGYEDDEISNNLSQWKELTEREEIKPSLDMINEVIEKKRDRYEKEFRMRHKDGHWVDILARANVTFNKEGKGVRVVGTHVDITKRKQYEKEILQEKQKAERYLNLAGVVFISLDKNGIVTIVNDYAAKVLEYEKSEIIGKEWFSMFLSPQVQTEVKEVFHHLINKEVEPVEFFENAVITKSGNRKIIAWHNTYLTDNDGNITGILSAGEDVTEKRYLEDRYHSIIQTSIDGFMRTDEKGDFLEVNRAYSEMIGYSEEELLSMNIRDIEYIESSEEVTKHIRKVIERGNDRFETRHLCKDGTILDLEIGTQHRVEKEGEFVSFVRDITEQKKIAELLQDAQKMESIGSLAGGIAHDFNNILTPIIGNADLLSEYLSPLSKEYQRAQDILKAGMRGADLVQQILTFSRRSTHEKAPVKIQDVLSEILTLLRATIPSNITIEKEISPICCPILAEKTQIHQVVMNIITNAFHAMDKEDGIISISLKESSVPEIESCDLPLPSGSYARIDISDNGCGMTEDVMKKIFEPYFTTKDIGKGTGLGLAVVYGIVREHGGDISVESTEGTGTTFHIYLPLMKAAEPSIDEERESDAPLGKEHILLVDDEDSITRLEEMILNQLGYKVSAYSDSLKALEAFTESPYQYDLVISDMTMPRLTGDKLAEKLHGVRNDIPIILCSGYGQRIEKAKAETLGIREILRKPIVKREFAPTIRKVLDSSREFS